MLRFIALAALSIGLCFAGLTCGLGMTLRHDVRQERFDATAWKAADLSKDNTRFRMLVNLADRMRTEHWSSTRIFEELGPPNGLAPYPSFDSANGQRSVWIYPMGPVLTMFTKTLTQKKVTLLIDHYQKDAPAIWTKLDGQLPVYYQRAPESAPIEVATVQ